MADRTPQEGRRALRQMGRPELPQATQRLAPFGPERLPWLAGGTYVQNGLPPASTHGG